MKELPILFSGPLVRAILAGTKTQTRRLVKPQPPPWCVEAGLSALTPPNHWEFRGCGSDGPASTFIHCPYLPASETRLWVRETWCLLDNDHWSNPDKPKDWLETRYGTPRRNAVAYRAETDADGERCRADYGYRWRPSIHMPRWASRLTLEIKQVRAERLQDITEEDAIAEGVASVSIKDAPRQAAWSHRSDFAALWDTIYSKDGHGWDASPWVYVVTFEKLK